MVPFFAGQPGSSARVQSTLAPAAPAAVGGAVNPRRTNVPLPSVGPICSESHFQPLGNLGSPNVTDVAFAKNATASLRIRPSKRNRLSVASFGKKNGVIDPQVVASS